MDARERLWRERGLREAVLAGDEAAWRQWYEECYAGLHTYVLWRCGGLRDPAEETVQEVWLTAVRRLATFDPAAGCFSAWLRGIAVNLLRNRFRRDARREPPPSTGQRWAEPADAELLRRERAEQVARALARLPGHYEAVLRAKYLDGQSVAAIAAERGESPKAVESLLGRAREAFRAAFEEED